MHKGRIPNFGPRRFIVCQEQIAEDIADFGLTRLFGDEENAATIIASANDIVSAGDTIASEDIAAVPFNNGDAEVADAIGGFGGDGAFDNNAVMDNGGALEDVEAIGGIQDIGNAGAINDIETVCGNEKNSVAEDETSGGSQDIGSNESADSIGCIAYALATDGNEAFGDLETIENVGEFACTDFESNGIGIGYINNDCAISDDESYSTLRDTSDFESIYSLGDFDYVGVPIGIEAGSDFESISGIEAISDDSVITGYETFAITEFDFNGNIYVRTAAGVAAINYFEFIGSIRGIAMVDMGDIGELEAFILGYIIFIDEEGGIFEIRAMVDNRIIGENDAIVDIDYIGPIADVNAIDDFQSIGDIEAINNPWVISNAGIGAMNHAWTNGDIGAGDGISVGGIQDIETSDDIRTRVNVDHIGDAGTNPDFEAIGYIERDGDVNLGFDNIWAMSDVDADNDINGNIRYNLGIQPFGTFGGFNESTFGNPAIDAAYIPFGAVDDATILNERFVDIAQPYNDFATNDSSNAYVDAGVFGEAESYGSPGAMADLGIIYGIGAFDDIRELGGMGGVIGARSYGELDPNGGAGAVFDVEAIDDIAAYGNERNLENIGDGNVIGFGSGESNTATLAEDNEFGALNNPGLDTFVIDPMAGGDIGAFIDFGAGGDFFPAIPFEILGLDQNVYHFDRNAAFDFGAAGDFGATIDIGAAGDATIDNGRNLNGMQLEMQAEIQPEMQPEMYPIIQPWMNATMMPWVNPFIQPWINPLMQPWMNAIMQPQMLLGMFPVMQPEMHQAIHPQIVPGMFPGMLPLQPPFAFNVEMPTPPNREEVEEIEEAGETAPNGTYYWAPFFRYIAF